MLLNKIDMAKFMSLWRIWNRMWGYIMELRILEGRILKIMALFFVNEGSSTVVESSTVVDKEATDNYCNIEEVVIWHSRFCDFFLIVAYWWYHFFRHTTVLPFTRALILNDFQVFNFWHNYACHRRYHGRNYFLSWGGMLI